jgi:Flp pilus assembly pilin Flp
MLKAYVFAQSKIGDVKDRLEALRADESGAAMIEYALLIGLIAIGGITALSALSTDLESSFKSIGASLTKHTAE